MNETDVKPQMLLANTKPEEAARNIAQAQDFGAEPDAYKEIAKSMQPQIEADKTPGQATPRVAQFVSKSEQHASLAKQDLDKLNGFEKYMHFASNQIKGSGITRELSDLSFRKANGETLTDDEQFRLDVLNSDLRSLNTPDDFQYSFLESLPANLAAGGVDYLKGLKDNYRTVLASTGFGAATGAGIGALGGVPGAIAGTAFGAGRGIIVGGLIAGVQDTYKQATGQIYNELSYSNGPDGSPLNMSEVEKQNISKGAGVLMATIGAVADVVTAKTVPWITKGLTPKVAINRLLRAENSQWLSIARSLGTSGLAGGVSGGSSEAVRIIAEEVGKTWNGTETSLSAGFKNAAARWQEYKGRVGEAATTGAAQAASFSAGAQIIGKVVGKAAQKARGTVPDGPERDVTPAPAPRLEAPQTAQGQFETGSSPAPVAPPSDLVGSSKNLPTVVRGTRALQLQIALSEASAITKETFAKQLAPQELNELRRQILDDAGVPYVWLDVEDLRKLSDNEQKGTRLRGLLDPSGIAAAQAGAPIRIATHKFLDFVDDHPEAAGMAKAEPEDMTAEQFNIWFKEAEQRRKEILGPLAEKQGDLQSFADQPRLNDAEIYNEQDYLNQPTFTPELESVIPQKERDKFNEMQRQVRLGVIESIDNAAENEMNKVLDVVVEIANAQEREAQADALVNDPRTNMVESFLTDRISGDLSPEQVARKKRGQRIFAINPDTMSSELKDRFRNIGTLKKRRVFAKDGISIGEAVKALEAKDANELLETLATAPTKQEAIDQAVALRSESLKADAEMAVDLNETAIAKAYNNMIKNHIDEMKFVLSKENWPTTRKAIYRASQPTPTIESLVVRARNIVMDTPVRGLNANQWKVGERRAQSKAMRTILKNEIEQYAVHKEEAAFNAAAAKETHIVTGKVNRATKRVRRLMTKSVQDELREAGPIYSNAVQEILEAFNFIPRSQNADRIGAYQKFVDKMLRSGQGDFKIPDDVLKWLVPQTSARDLTAEQFLYVTDKLESILKQARLKNELLGKYRDRQMQLTTEMLQDVLVENAQKHPDFNPEKAVRGQGSETISLDKISHWLAAAESTITNLQMITLQLDQGDQNGIWSQMIFQPLKGTGKHQGPFGELAYNKLAGEVNTEIKRQIELYGKKEWNNLGIKKVFVPEFKNVPGLKNGKMTKIDLIMMAAHTGNDENFESLTNYGISKELIGIVLDRELTLKDWDFVQRGLWDSFASFKSRIAALEKMTKGTEPDFVQPTPFEKFGRSFKGGYFPLMYTKDTSANAIREMKAKRFESATGDSKVTLTPIETHDGIVRSPHTKERVGSQWEVDLSPTTFAAGMDNLIYDLTMRVPVADTMKILQDPKIAEAMMSVVGPEKYSAAVNSVAEATRSYVSDNIMLHGEQQKFITKAIKHVSGASAISWIAYNASSVLVQGDSMRNVLNKMGVVNGSKHISWVLIHTAANVDRLPELYKEAAKIDPSIEAYRQGIDDHTIGGLLELMPKKRLLPGKAYHLIKNAQEYSQHVAIQTILGTVDVSMKVATVLGAKRQFLQGEAPGWPLERLAKMSPVELDAAANAYAAGISSSSLTAGSKIDRAAVQKTMPGYLFSRFWNDGRNSINSNLQITRNTRYDVEKAIEFAKKGEYTKANAKFSDAGTNAFRALSLSVLGMAFLSLARGRNPVAQDGEELSVAESIDKVPEYVLTRGPLDYGNDLFGQHVPFLRDIIFAAGSFSKGDEKNVSAPITRAASDVATAGSALYQNFSEVTDYLSAVEAVDNLSSKQTKALFATTSLFTGGLPVNGVAKTIDYLNARSEADEPLLPGGQYIKAALSSILSMFIENNSKEMTEEEAFKRMLELSEHPERAFLVDQAKQMLAQVSPEKPQMDEIDEQGFEIMKHAESGGKWNAMPLDENGDPLSSAFGVYQFTYKTWRGIMLRAPELNLTPRGRVAKDGVQQEKAMRWLVKDNSRQLRQAEIPVTLQSIYAAHHFGATGAIRIYQADPNEKTKKILGEDAIKANPWLSKYPTISKLKKYLDKRIEDGRKGYEAAQR